MKEKSERMWKEAVVAYFKTLSQCFPRRTVENHENLQPV
jgi:hypothetical protein